jgi:hypothetical protein
MQPDWTYTAVTRQIKGMGCDMYDVGIRHLARGMLNRERWESADIIKALPWLKRENYRGCDVFIRPARSALSRLVLIDDVLPDALARLQAGPYRAAVTVQTSPGNFQAWIKLDGDQPANVRHEVARYLAHAYGGDRNSADAWHFGRLAGFTNRKPEHVDAANLSPYVLLGSYNGQPATGSAELVRIASATIEQVREQARKMSMLVEQKARHMPDAAAHTHVEIGGWYKSLWRSLKAAFGNEFDPSRADWMAALAMFRRGHDYRVVENAIAQHSPGINDRKGTAVDDYVTRTAGKAEIWSDLQKQGKHYGDVADTLLRLARERRQQRAAKAESLDILPAMSSEISQEI